MINKYSHHCYDFFEGLQWYDIELKAMIKKIIKMEAVAVCCLATIHDWRNCSMWRRHGNWTSLREQWDHSSLTWAWLNRTGALALLIIQFRSRNNEFIHVEQVLACLRPHCAHNEIIRLKSVQSRKKNARTDNKWCSDDH